MGSNKAVKLMTSDDHYDLLGLYPTDMAGQELMCGDLVVRYDTIMSCMRFSVIEGFYPDGRVAIVSEGNSKRGKARSQNLLSLTGISCGGVPTKLLNIKEGIETTIMKRYGGE